MWRGSRHIILVERIRIAPQTLYVQFHVGQHKMRTATVQLDMSAQAVLPRPLTTAAVVALAERRRGEEGHGIC